MNDSTPVGYLRQDPKSLYHGTFVCMNCANDNGVCTPEDIKFYRVNIGSYKQTCHLCDKTIVEGQTPAWCELFPKPGQITKDRIEFKGYWDREYPNENYYDKS
jgi:hypothetical protein